MGQVTQQLSKANHWWPSTAKIFSLKSLRLTQLQLFRFVKYDTFIEKLQLTKILIMPAILGHFFTELDVIGQVTQQLSKANHWGPSTPKILSLKSLRLTQLQLFSFVKYDTFL